MLTLLQRYKLGHSDSDETTERTHKMMSDESIAALYGEQRYEDIKVTPLADSRPIRSGRLA